MSRSPIGLAALDDQKEWSDDLGYLMTISNLINNAHAASADNDQDVYDWVWILEQLQIEIEGQLYVKGKEDTVKKLDEMRISVKKTLKEWYVKYGNRVGSLTQPQADSLREIVLPYHRLLNKVIHEQQLRLRNFEEARKRLPVESRY